MVTGWAFGRSKKYSTFVFKITNTFTPDTWVGESTHREVNCPVYDKQKTLIKTWFLQNVNFIIIIYSFIRLSE